MTRTEIFLAATALSCAFGWLMAIQETREEFRRFTQCRDELYKLTQSIRQTDELARKSKFIHLYP
jgi:hypothetical protein